MELYLGMLMSLQGKLLQPHQLSLECLKILLGIRQILQLPLKLLQLLN